MVGLEVHDALLQYAQGIEREAGEPLSFGDAIASLLAQAGQLVNSTRNRKRMGRPPKALLVREK